MAGTAAAKDGHLVPGDELVTVMGANVAGATLAIVKSLIGAVSGEVTLGFVRKIAGELV